MKRITEQDKLNILEKLNSFIELDYEGWDGYDAEPITSGVIEHSKEVLNHFEYALDVFPLSYNGVQFEWEDEKYYLELEVKADKSYHLYGEYNNEEFIDLESFDLMQMIVKLNDIFEKIVLKNLGGEKL